jgi:hypothetical protein
VKKVYVTWQTEEVREYESELEIPDSVVTVSDLEEYFHGDSAELVQAEEGLAYDLASFLRDVTTLRPVDWEPEPDPPAAPWSEIPGYPFADWQAEVADGDTQLGYAEWAAAQMRAAGVVTA